VISYTVGDEVRVFPLHPGNAPDGGWRGEVTAVRGGVIDVLVTGAEPALRLSFSLADGRSAEPGGQYVVRPAEVGPESIRQEGSR
jgi:hypothetical protein